MLEKAIAMKMKLGATDRIHALIDIELSVDQTCLFSFCKQFGLLVDNSAEQFSREFYMAFNDEIYYKY